MLSIFTSNLTCLKNSRAEVSISCNSWLLCKFCFQWWFCKNLHDKHELPCFPRRMTLVITSDTVLRAGSLRWKICWDILVSKICWDILDVRFEGQTNAGWATSVVWNDNVSWRLWDIIHCLSRKPANLQWKYCENAIPWKKLKRSAKLTYKLCARSCPTENVSMVSNVVWQNDEQNNKVKISDTIYKTSYHRSEQVSLNQWRS